MMMPALLVVAVLGLNPQEPPDAPPEAAVTSGSASEAIRAGLAAFDRRRFTQARAEFQRAVEADPQSAAAHFYLGYVIYKIAEPRRRNDPGKQEAAEHFAKAYELDPAFKPVWGTRG
ncbi:MAG TPA: tetratricopeptide repeat protein [Vicinamibacteria bacterium]|nr:tetratricopeptide repeat protein [Vicinamibacteria bacterium]